MNVFLTEGAAILGFVAKAFLHILPFLAISIPLAVALKRTGAADKIRSSLSGNPIVAVVFATVAGAVSPFCSCGVVPVISALLIAGVPLAPVMSFWLASPSMDPEIFVLSVGSIGLELAVWRLAATFVMSLGGGLAILVLERQGWIGRDVLAPALLGKVERADAPRFRPALATANAASPLLASTPTGSLRTRRSGTESAAGCGCSGRTDPAPAPAVKAGSTCGCGGVKASSRGELAHLARDAGKTALNLSLAMLFAFVLEALIQRYVPSAAVAGLLGGDKPWSVALASLLGVPMYTTNLSALGIASGLIAKGASGGAILAFLVGGAVTTLPAMAAVYKLVRPRVFALYLFFCAAGSLLAGYAFEFAHIGA